MDAFSYIHASTTKRRILYSRFLGSFLIGEPRFRLNAWKLIGCISWPLLRLTVLKLFKVIVQLSFLSDFRFKVDEGGAGGQKPPWCTDRRPNIRKSLYSQLNQFIIGTPKGNARNSKVQSSKT